jgi:hypothetical protein
MMSRTLRVMLANRQKLRDEIFAADAEMPDDLGLETQSLDRVRVLCNQLRAVDREIAGCRPRTNKEALAIAIGPLLCAVVTGDDELAAALRSAVMRKGRARKVG